MEFRKVIIGDICELVTDYVANGSFKSLAENVKYSDKGYARVIRLVDYNNKFEKKDSIWVSKDAYEFLKKSKLDGGEIVITNVGANLGTVFIVPKLDYPQTLGPNSIIIKTKENDQYIYYLLLSRYGQNKIKEIVSGSAMPKFNKTDFKNIIIQLPNIENQNKIVKILSTLDKKIELNNQINNNLLELGDTLIGKLNTDNHVRLGDLASVISKGTTPTKKDIENSKEINNIKFIRVTDFNEFGIDKNNLQYIPEDVHTGKLKRSILKENDILVSIAGTLGKIAIVTKKLDNSNTNQAVAFVRLKEINDRGYIYFYMKTKAFQDEIESKKVHAVQPNLSLTELSNIKIIKIDEDKKQIFNIILDKILQNVNQNYTLMQIRDTLLPKLIHGDIDLENINI